MQRFVVERGIYFLSFGAICSLEESLLVLIRGGIKKMSEKAYQAVELANKSGKIKKGVNEVTKVVEKGQAKLVLFAGDVSPKEIVMHLPMICKEKKVPCVEVPSRAELGAAAGLPVGTVAVVVVEAGEAKDLIKEF